MIRTVIIDDEKENREVISHMLESHFPKLSVANSADGVKTGYEAIRNLSPELVLLDIRMEDDLAFDLLKKLDHIDFKIVFITATALSE